VPPATYRGRRAARATRRPRRGRGYNGAVNADASLAGLLPEKPPAQPVLAVTTRSGAVESWHRGAIAIVHGDELAFAFGDVRHPVFARSAVKPFQALPLLERGLADELGLPPEEIVVMCASHDGAPGHVAAVRSLLARGGFTEEQLGCGPHAPFDQDSRQALLRAGEKPRKVHNNCSGKHAGFLHLARACGDDLAHYLDPGCVSQGEVNAAVAAMAGLRGWQRTGLDGCGAPTFVLPLAALAAAFARLVNPAAHGPVRARACQRILAAVGQTPVLLAGERRFCTALVRQWPGRAFAKNGAEGVYALALAADPARSLWPGPLGIAIKIDDGAERAYQPVLVDLLQRMDVLGQYLPDALAPFAAIAIENTQRRRVGEVRSVLPWPQA